MMLEQIGFANSTGAVCAERIGGSDENHVAAMRRLWVACLARNWDWSFDAKGYVAPSRVDRRALIKECRVWFGSRDFYTVCALAGLEGSAVLERWRLAQERFRQTGHYVPAAGIYKEAEQ